MQVTVVDSEYAGMRLDLFLARQRLVPADVGEWSRSGIQKMIQTGHIVLNGQRTKPSARLKTSDLIEIRELPVRDSELVPEPISLSILHEDADCIVVNKPPGMVVHPAAGRRTGTLVNALLYHCPDLPGIGGERRPGIVHRLDKDTSGVIIVAKHEHAFRQLALQFKERRVLKEYVALVWGRVDREKGLIRRPIGRHRSDRKRMSSLYSLPRLREATTEWQVEEWFHVDLSAQHDSWVTWLRVAPRTGRTHQIRVHLSDQGYPIVGDPIYGRKRRAPLSSRPEIPELADFPRQALHAERLGFSHPRTGATLEVTAPLFLDMKNLLEGLRKQGKEIKERTVGG
jgi:23S rRNA pseudouridine1911/1915/1917 synthase